MNHRSILLVEDDPRDVALTLRALRKACFANEIVVAHDGVEALEYLFATDRHAARDRFDLPELLLLNLRLPKLDGIQVLHRVRANCITRLLPVVVITSTKEEEERINSFELGSCSFLHKPIAFFDFQQATKQLGLSWMLGSNNLAIRNDIQPAERFGSLM
jgi:two-component system response regulator